MEGINLGLNSLGRYTLTIDGNWWLISRMFTCTNPNTGKQVSFRLDEDTPDGITLDEKIANDRESFICKLVRDLSTELRKMPFVDSVIFVIDGRSWRKDIEYLPKWFSEYQQTPSIGKLYKANRKDKEDLEFDFKESLKVLKEYLNKLESEGLLRVFNVDNAEGDDLIYFGNKYLNVNLGKNSIFMSSDGDLPQTVNACYKTGTLSAYYNKKRAKTGDVYSTTARSYETEKFRYLKGLIMNYEAPKDNVSMQDILEGKTVNLDDSKNHTKMLNRFFDDTEEFNTFKYLLTKILEGDSGDNVFAVMYKQQVDHNTLKLFQDQVNKGIALTDEQKKLLKKTEKNVLKKEKSVNGNRLTPLVINRLYDALLTKGTDISKQPLDKLYDDTFIRSIVMGSYYFLHSFNKPKKGFPTMALSDEELDFYIQRFKQNRNLMVLNFKEIPKSVIKGAVSQYETLTPEFLNNFNNTEILRDKDRTLQYFDLVDTDTFFANDTEIIQEAIAEYGEQDGEDDDLLMAEPTLQLNTNINQDDLDFEDELFED